MQHFPDTGKKKKTSKIEEKRRRRIIFIITIQPTQWQSLFDLFNKPPSVHIPYYVLCIHRTQIDQQIFTQHNSNWFHFGRRLFIVIEYPYLVVVHSV